MNHVLRLESDTADDGVVRNASTVPVSAGRMGDDVVMADRRLSWVARAALSAALLRVVLAGHRLWYDSPEYVRGARALLGDGSYERVRYPPGFPAMLAVADLVGLPYWTVPMASGLALVGLIWWAATKLGGPIAGLSAAVFCMLSDLIGESGVMLMADTPAGLFAVAGLVAAMHGRWGLAGVMVAASTWVRLVHGAFIATLWGRRRAFLLAVAGMVPLAVFNVAVFGSLSTYDSNQAGWSLLAFREGVSLDGQPATDSNWVYYLSVLGGRWGHLLPVLPVLAGVEMWRRRSDRVTWMAGGIAVINLASYAFYYFQSARFVLPAAAIIVIYSAACVGSMVTRRATRGRSGQRTTRGSPFVAR